VFQEIGCIADWIGNYYRDEWPVIRPSINNARHPPVLQNVSGIFNWHERNDKLIGLFHRFDPYLVRSATLRNYIVLQIKSHPSGGSFPWQFFDCGCFHVTKKELNIVKKHLEIIEFRISDE